MINTAKTDYGPCLKAGYSVVINELRAFLTSPLLFSVTEGILGGDNSLPTNVWPLVKPLGPGLAVLFEFDFVLVNFDNFYAADDVPFMNKPLTD